MQFEMFDRDTAAVGAGEQAPMVRVSPVGRLLFNPPSRAFLEEQYGAATQLEVALLFSAETRTVGVRPLLPREAAELPVGSRWPVAVQRSREWPVGIDADSYVGHYQIAGGEYPATLMRGPGPRMLTFRARTTAASSRRGRALAAAGRTR